MSAIAISRYVDAPPDRVWEVLTDIARSPEVIRAIDAVEVHTGSGFDVGTRWTETRTMMGRTVSETMEVTGLESGRSYVVEANSRGTHYRSEFDVAPDNEGTMLTMSFAGEPSGIGGKIMVATLGRLFAGQTRKALAADLEDIARASERRS